MNKAISYKVQRSYSYALLLLLLLFLGACASTHREKMLEESLELDELVLNNEDLEARFTSDKPTHEELLAFESRARQKLQDFADYLNLLYENQLDSVFNDQVIRQMENLFVDKQVKLSIKNNQVLSLEELLKQLKTENTSAGMYKIQQIELSKHLGEDQPHIYTGELSFVQSLNHEDRPSQDRKAHFIVKKVPKQFGNQEEMVWEVLLADIE